MEFTRRGPAAAASDDGGRRFPDPPPHGDAMAMAVTRDALLAQLQKDRLRQEIIVAEVAKIERAMALRAAAAATSVERGDPWSASGEEIVYRGRNDCTDFDVGEERGLRLPTPNRDARQQSSAEPKSGKPFLEDRTHEPSKPCRCEGKAASDDQKPPESDETLPPEKTTASAAKWELTGITIPVKRPKPPPQLQWDCAVCQVKGTGEFNLLLHRAGQKHTSNAAAMESKTEATDDREANTAAEPPVVGADEKPPAMKWTCSICQAVCNSEWDVKNHLKGEQHQAKMQSLSEEGSNMTRNAESQPKPKPQHADGAQKTMIWTWSCGICQAHCTSESDLRNHLRGKRHQLNFQALLEEAEQEKNQNNLPKQPPPNWCCNLCKAKCETLSQYVDHCMGRKHQQKVEALPEERKNWKANETPSDGPSSKKASNQKTAMPFVYLCKLCDVPCNSEKMLAHHRAGKKHAEKVMKVNELWFCEVCDLQCNSQKMLAHHRSGKKHLQNLAKQKSPYYCEVCDLQCSDEKMLTGHRFGKKHRAKLSEKK